MPRKSSKTSATDSSDILSYRHPDKRSNNPEVGMVTPATDPDAGKTKWAYDPHLDPTLNWAGKAERTSFEVDLVSLHVHERVDPASILSAVRKAANGEGKSKGAEKAIQPGLFDAPFENLPLRDAIDFYRHERGWANRLISGDSLLVMNSLLQKESMAGKVQMIYIDPPYGIKYGSNFQPFVGKKEVKDRSDGDLTQEPEMIKAFRDTWELGVHSYLTYLRDRLLLARDLLHDSGSVFVQISDENLHYVRLVLDEIFGAKNFISAINFRKKTMPLGAAFLEQMSDYIVWYAKDSATAKTRKLYKPYDVEGLQDWKWYEKETGEPLPLKDVEVKKGEGEVYRLKHPSPIGYSEAKRFPYTFRGKTYSPPANGWGIDKTGIDRLAAANRLQEKGAILNYKIFHSDSPYTVVTNPWSDTVGPQDKSYVVQTADEVLQRCILMTTDPGDLILDPTCGSGTSAFVAEKWGRRWITCDTSRVAVTLAKQRLMTSSFDYYELRYPNEGLRGGFIYKTAPRVTLSSIASNSDIDEIYARMHPAITSALADLNNQLMQGSTTDTFVITEGGRKGTELDFKKGDSLMEWEVPFNFPETWPEVLRAPFDSFHAARQAMRREIDRKITEGADREILHDQPIPSKTKLRVSGPFTVEAVPFPTVKSLDEVDVVREADASIARSGESGRQHKWRDELVKTGIRGKSGQMLKFADLESLPADADIRNLHALGHLDSGEVVVVNFGPEHAALEQRQVENAFNEAGKLFPRPTMIVFCAFTFDPEAAKDIDGIKGITALKAQMNTDLLTEDLKKARSSNQSFWLMGQPEVEVKKLKDGKLQVEVHGFDYFDTVKGELVSGGKSKIAMWALDTDYDERSLFPRQVFFPMAGSGEGWEKLKKSIRAALDEVQLEAFHGTLSLPFEVGENRKLAVKIVDDRGIESLKVVTLD
jgi:adenine-specific DNA-methyltransferase